MFETELIVRRAGYLSACFDYFVRRFRDQFKPDIPGVDDHETVAAVSSIDHQRP